MLPRINKTYWYGRYGTLKIDGQSMGAAQADGNPKYLEVEPTFYLGNIPPQMREEEVVQKHLQVARI